MMNPLIEISKRFLIAGLGASFVLILLFGCVSHSNIADGKTKMITAPTTNSQIAPSELFDGTTLTGWNVTEYSGQGKVELHNGIISIGAGDGLTGINWTNHLLATDNYEITLSARRVSGSDFFCGLTFPVGETNCTLIVGGWGGTVVGLSSINGEDASENETSQFVRFDNGKWYSIRLRVTPPKIEMWLDSDRLINFVRADKSIGLRFGAIDMSLPLGLTTYETEGEIKDLKFKRVQEK